jgi:drug/metabolite transporter (DMT)-like permease
MYILGLGIVIFGLAFLLRNLGVIYFPGSFWSLFYPLIIVGLGLAVICVTHEGRKLLKKLKNIFRDKE